MDVTCEDVTQIDNVYDVYVFGVLENYDSGLDPNYG